MSLLPSSSSSGYESHSSPPPRNRADTAQIRRPYAHQDPMRNDSWRPEPGRYDDANRHLVQRHFHPRHASDSYRSNTRRRSEYTELNLNRSFATESSRGVVRRSPPREPRRMRMYPDTYRPQYDREEHSILLSKSQKKRARRAKRHGDSWTPEVERNQDIERGNEHLHRGRDMNSRNTFGRG